MFAAAQHALSPKRREDVEPPFSPIPDDPHLTQSEGEGDKSKMVSPCLSFQPQLVPQVTQPYTLTATSLRQKKEKGLGDTGLQSYYYEKMSKDRTESHVLEELDTANVDVMEDKDEEEVRKSRRDAVKCSYGANIFYANLSQEERRRLDAEEVRR